MHGMQDGYELGIVHTSDSIYSMLEHIAHLQLKHLSLIHVGYISLACLLILLTMWRPANDYTKHMINNKPTGTGSL